jgi:hypothetical protein
MLKNQRQLEAPARTFLDEMSLQAPALGEQAGLGEQASTDEYQGNRLILGCVGCAEWSEKGAESCQCRTL